MYLKQCLRFFLSISNLEVLLRICRFSLSFPSRHGLKKIREIWGVKELCLILFLVTPKAVPIVTAKKNFGNCTFVQWKPINTGFCPVEYTVQFMNNSDTLGIVPNISHTENQICEKQFLNATSVVVRATYNGTIGVRSTVNVRVFTTTTTPETITATNKPGKSF